MLDHRLTRLALVCIALAWGARATAQPAGALPLGEPATQGVRNPNVGVASDPDASAVERNPATLGFLRSWSGVFLHTELDRDRKVGGAGNGFFFAAPLPFVSSIAMGAGVQLVRPPSVFPFRDTVKLSLALAWRLHDLLSLGLVYAHVTGQQAPVSDGLDTLDLAAAGRLGRYIGWGLVVHDVTAAQVSGVPLQRVYEPEVAIRPLGTNRLELALGARFGERRGDVDPHFRVWAVPYRGFSVKADVEWRRDSDLDGRPENDVRIALGVALDLERFGVAGFGLFGREDGFTRGQGFSLLARVSGERYPTFWRGPRYLERVELTRELKGRRLLEVLDRLRALEHDDATHGVLLVGGELGAGWAAAEELRAALLRLRRAGKHVIALLLHVDGKGYLAASAAERIVLDPSGDLQLTGIAISQPYFKGTGELLGIRGDFVRIGEAKSSPERYTSDGPSPAVRAAAETYLDDLYRHLTEAIGASRRLPLDEVRRRIDGGPYSPAGALASKLVDEVRQGEELPGIFSDLIGPGVGVREMPTAPRRAEAWGRAEIAVLHIDGDLVSGPSRSLPLVGLRATGLVELSTALDRAVRDPHVRAIVLRIDSPGGAAIAADLLTRELEHARAEKPVVCSLGDTAASGGYWVASGCEEIFAAPSTLTGSIGIYTGKLDFSGLLARLGVSLVTLARGAHAGLDSPFRPYAEEERAALMKVLRHAYDRFIATVARGRRMSAPAVEAVAQGRIYSGDRARALGLVDHHGGLIDAIEAAARRARVSVETPIRIYPEPPSLLGQVGALLGLPAKKREPIATGLPTVEELGASIPSSVVFEPSLPQARLEP